MNQKQGAGKNKHHQLLWVFILIIALFVFFGFNVDWKLFASSMSWEPSEKKRSLLDSPISLCKYRYTSNFALCC